MIKIMLNYNNGNYTINILKFEKLIAIKKKAYQLFFPIKSDIDIKYNNKSMSSNLDESLGLIFKDKKAVKLDIVAIPGRKKSLKIKPKKKNENKIEGEGQNNLQKNKNITQNLIKEISTNTSNDLKNKSVGKLKNQNNINKSLKKETNNINKNKSLSKTKTANNNLKKMNA